MKGVIVYWSICCFAALSVSTETRASEKEKTKTAPPRAASSIDTKGTPLKGSITDSNGNEIAQLEFFGEGTPIIYFDGHQNLILEDEKGNIIAGFKASAIDPNKRGVTQAYVVEEADGKQTMMLEHEVAVVEFREGVLKIKNPQLEMLTSFKAKDKQLRVRFKDINHTKDDNGGVINKFTVVADDGQLFEFVICTSSSMRHTLKPQKGNLAVYLSEKKKSIEAEQKTPGK